MATSSAGRAASSRATSGTTEGLGRANAASVLSSVLIGGPLARAEIADLVGLTRATVTRVANRLIEVGLLTEEPPRRESAGRPLIPLAFDGEDRAVIAVHFGVTESRVGVVDLQGRVLSEERDRYLSQDPAALSAIASRRVSEAVELHRGKRRILGVGASVGGWVEPESGEVIRFEPLGWERVPLADMLAADLGNIPLYFDQTVRGLAIAERMFGAARGVGDFLELWVGNVVGAAIVHEGVVRRGARGASGIVTHFPTRSAGGRCECGRDGCLVHTINDEAVLEQARSRGIGDYADIRDLLQAAKGGDRELSALIADRARIAGEAAAAMADLVNPSRLVVAGLITTAPGYLDAFAAEFRSRAELGDLLEVRASEFGDLAPTIASASVMLDQYFRDPLGFERLTI